MKSTVFSDVPKAFERWHSEGGRIAIYSSGSVLVQRRSMLRVTGASRQWLSVTPEEILFFSDSIPELDAAVSIGLDVRLTIRPGNWLTSPSVHHLAVFSVDEL